MLKKIILIILFSLYSFKIYAFEPYSGISCHSDKVKGKEEYFFKHDENHIYATAYKRINGQFIKVGNVVGQKVSSFLLFEDITIESGADMVINSGSTLTINGLLRSNSSASILTNNGTLIINHSSFMPGSNGPSTNFFSTNGDLTINSTLDFPVPTDNYQNITINGAVTLIGDVSVKGNMLNNGTFNFSGTPTLTFDGSNTQSISG